MGADRIFETLFFLFESNEKVCQQILTDFLANILVLFPRSFENGFDDHQKIIFKFLKQVLTKRFTCKIIFFLLSFTNFIIYSVASRLQKTMKLGSF